jgi:hypothetical protein
MLWARQIGSKNFRNGNMKALCRLKKNTVYDSDITPVYRTLSARLNIRGTIIKCPI